MPHLGIACPEHATGLGVSVSGSVVFGMREGRAEDLTEQDRSEAMEGSWV